MNLTKCLQFSKFLICKTETMPNSQSCEERLRSSYCSAHSGTEHLLTSLFFTQVEVDLGPSTEDTFSPQNLQAARVLTCIYLAPNSISSMVLGFQDESKPGFKCRLLLSSGTRCPAYGHHLSNI